MATQSELSISGAERLLELDQEQQLKLLGLRSVAIDRDPSIQGEFEPALPPDEDFGLAEDLRKVGERMWNKAHIQAYNLVCGTDEENRGWRDKITAGLGVSSAAVVVAITGFLVSGIGLAAALAGVIAAIAVKHFFEPVAEEGYEAACALWKEKLPQSNE